MTLDELKSKREVFRTRLFYLMLEIAVIFAVPAVVVAMLGGKKLLFVTFALSWVLVIYRYRKAARAIKEINQEIKKLS